MLDATGSTPWRVTDLKQYVYCARVFYYHACLPTVRPVTYKMQAGVDAGIKAGQREQRRGLRAYGLESGRREFQVPLVSHRLGMRGKVDMVIETGGAGEPQLIPVDYKLSKRSGRHFKLQLAAYALMLEEERGIPVRRSFLYLIPLRRAEEVKISSALRRSLERAVRDMNDIMLRERMPEGTGQRGKCVSCEFRRYCNDVV